MELLGLIYGFGWLFGLLYVYKFAAEIYVQAESIVGKAVAWIIGLAGFSLITTMANKLFDTLH